MQKLRKALVISVMTFTVLSMCVVAAPKVEAAAVAGDLIKMNGLSSVYFLAADGKRYVFPNESTYFSWYGDFSGVVTIPQAELESYPLGKNITVRPGTKLVKITTNPNVYAVTPGGVLVKVPSEATATTLFGANWAKRVIDISDAFFTNYTIGSGEVSATAYPAGSLVKFGTSPDVFYIAADGKAQKIATESAFLANRFKWNDIVTATITAPTAGADITAAVTTLTDTSSGAGGAAGAGTGLTVALSASTPVSASVPQDGARVPMAKVNLTASNDGNVTVNSITVKRTGLSTYGQMSKVWAEKEGVLVASKKSVNSNDEAILTFSPALVITSGTTVTLDLIATLLEATGNIGVGIQNASAISTNGAAVSGSFPINGNLMSPINYKLVRLSLTSTDPTYSVKVGDEKAEIGKFEIGFNTYDSATAKDVTLKSVMLKNNGVEDLAGTAMNFYLEYNGDKVSESAVVNGRYVTFYFPAATGLDLLKDDSSKIFYVKADIIGKENSDTGSYDFTLNKSTDIDAFEKATGFGINVYTSSSNNTLADGVNISAASIAAGVITVSKKSTSPSDTTIIKGSDNTVLIANIRADEAITADGIKVVYGSTTTASTVDQFENVRVYLNGILLDSFDPTASGIGLSTQTLDSALTLNKGDNEIKVMAKAKTTATANSAFFAKLDSASVLSSMNPEYVSSGNAVDTTDISGTATGGFFTVQGAVLATVRNDGYSDGKSIVQGSNDVSLGKFALKATNDTIKVTSISLGANASSTLPSSIFDAKIFVDGVQVGNTVDFGNSGATFTSLNFFINKDATKNIEFKASFDSAAIGGFKATTTINAQDSRGVAIATGNTASTITLALKAAGSLTVALGGDSPAAALLAATASEQEIAQYKFTAVDDSATLTEINFANTSSSTAVDVTSDADPRVSAIKLYDGTTLIDQTQLVSGLGTFNVGSKVVVPANGTKTLSVKVVLNEISNDAAATNKELRFALKDVKFKSSAGTVNGPQTENDIANLFRIRKTIPTVALQNLPNTLLTSGDFAVSKFTVTANASGDVSLHKVVLTYATSTSLVTVAGMDNAVTVNGATKAVTSVLDTGAKTLTVTFSSDEVISAGTSKTFEIYATLGVSGSGSESFTTKIVKDSTYGTTGSFEWSDGASVSAPTYSNGTNVPGLTTNTQTISKN
jgi:hypothetical protein